MVLKKVALAKDLTQEERDKKDRDILAEANIFFTTPQKLLNWGRSRSFWPLNYGSNCCPIEMMASSLAPFDISRFGYEVFRSGPRQADLLVIAGPLTIKLRPVLERLWDQMPAPKWVVCLGNCACSGGPFKDGYSVYPGADTVFDVDVYIPGCPPRPEAFFQGLLELKRLVETTDYTAYDAWKKERREAKKAEKIAKKEEWLEEKNKRGR